MHPGGPESHGGAGKAGRRARHARLRKPEQQRRICGRKKHRFGTGNRMQRGACGEPGNVHVSYFEHFVPAAHSGEYDCVPHPVRQRQSRRRYCTGYSGYPCQYRSGDCVLPVFRQTAEKEITMANVFANFSGIIIPVVIFT